MIEIPSQYVKNLYKLALVFFTILSLLYAVRILAEFRYYRNSDQGFNSITLSGHGEVFAVPDIATIYFSVESSKPTQGGASDEVNTKTKNILDFLKSSGVVEKDIKTENYSSYPKYSNPAPCVYSGSEIGYPNSPSMMYPCPSSTESKIIGYVVSQSVTVKIRKVDDSSKIIDGINKIGVTNMSGPNLTIDDEDALKAEAKKLAIDDAKAKAKVLAKDLDVRLGKIMSFSDNGDYPMPYYGGVMMGASYDQSVKSAPAEIPKGENTITADVMITYEIR
jgi:uncharacterized protein YggE